MGGKQSIEQNLNLESVTKSVQKQFTENKAVSKVSGTNVQSLKLKIGVADGCPITTNQKITSKVVSKTENMGKVAAEMSSKVANDLQQKADAALEKVSGFLSTDIGSKQDIKQNINTKIKNITEKTMSVKNMSEAIASSVNVQGQTLEIGYCGPKTKINLNQDITSELAAKAVVKTVTDAILKDEYVNKVVQDIGAKQKMENRGPFESIGAMFGSVYSVAVCAIICCIIIAVLGAGVMMMGGGGSGGGGGYNQGY